MSNEVIAGIVGAIIGAFVAGVVAWYSLSVTKEQFKMLNQGYLDITPQISLHNENIDRKEIILNIDNNFPVDGFGFYIILKNVGNIPLKYNVKKFDIYINGEKYSGEFKKTDNTLGIVYPKQEIKFYRETVYFDKFQHKIIPFSAVKKLNIINEIVIKYNSINAPKDFKYIDRKLQWTLHDNVARLSYENINDKF